MLGIDPGLTRCGYAVIDGKNVTSARAVSMGVIRTKPSEPLAYRLATLRTEFTSLIAEFEPDSVAVEQVFFPGQCSHGHGHWSGQRPGAR